MIDFFESKNINENQRAKIIKFLMNRYPRFDAPITKLKECIELLESKNMVFYMRYFRIIKVLFRFNLTV